MASNAELSTINQSQNLTTIKNLKSESDSKLSLDLGDTFNLQNIDGFDIKLSQIKIGEEAVKTLEDGKTYQVFDDSSNVIDLNGSASIYYSGNKYSVTQDTADNKYLKVNWIGNSSGLREAAELRRLQIEQVEYDVQKSKEALELAKANKVAKLQSLEASKVKLIT